jgi:hypothetical protein
MFPMRTDLVNCAQLRISPCCTLVPIKATDRAAGGYRRHSRHFDVENYATICPLVGLFLNGAIEVHTTSIGADW